MHWPNFITAKHIWIVGVLTVVVCEVFYLSEFKFSREISIVDVVTGLLTLFLGFYIPHRIEKSLNSRRYELEALIEDVKRVQVDLSSVWEVVQTASTPVTETESNSILRHFENASLGLQSLETIAIDCQLNDIVISVKLLERVRRSYKRLVTGNGFQGPTFSFTPNSVRDITQEYFVARMSCSRLILQINRS